MLEGPNENKEDKKVKTTCAIILNDKGEVLLTKRAREPHKGKWALISGIGESKENRSPGEAVREEVARDLGTKSFKGENIFSIEVANSEKTDGVIVFAGKIEESEIIPQSGLSDGTKWRSLEEISREQLAFEHNEILKKYLDNKK